MAVTHQDVANLNQSFDGMARTLLERKVLEQRDAELTRRSELYRELRKPKSQWQSLREEMDDFVTVSTDLGREMAEAAASGDMARAEMLKMQYEVIQGMSQKRLERLQTGQFNADELVEVKVKGPKGEAPLRVPRNEFDARRDLGAGSIEFPIIHPGRAGRDRRLVPRTRDPVPPGGSRGPPRHRSRLYPSGTDRKSPGRAAAGRPGRIDPCASYSRPLGSPSRRRYRRFGPPVRRAPPVARGLDPLLWADSFQDQGSGRSEPRPAPPPGDHPVLERTGSAEYRASLDGNESFRTGAAFAAFWQSLCRDPALDGLLARLLFIEQPLHRAIALGEPLLETTRPDGIPCPVIIDESDAELDSLPRALELGYAGTSHKNCKGVFKGIANRCLILSRQQDGGRTLLMSGENLSNIGPVALLQDLAVQATLGIESVERNGHHYFAGLAAFPESLQSVVFERHHDLYLKEPGRAARITLSGGRLSTRSVLQAPFGCAFLPDLESFAPKI